MTIAKYRIQIPGKLLKGIELTGDAWTLCIIHVLKDGPLRFCGIQRTLGDVNPTTLANRLKKLEKNGLVERQEETMDKLSVTYSLTGKGRSVSPIINTIGTFAEANL